MLLDIETTLSVEQKITASANSTDVLDLGAAGSNLGAGQPVAFGVMVTEDFTDLTSLKVDLVAASDAGLTSDVVVIGSTGLVLAADLAAVGKLTGYVNPGKGRYVGFKYTVAGTPSTGAVTSFVNLDVPAGETYAAAYEVITN